jgi:tRNA pseudouridine55 synthase
MISGVLVLDKPQGPTSHDMVAVARRALGERRIGHCGTLDPLATGVLALAVGQATRLVQYLSAEEKHYDAVVTFGRDTKTYDATGETVAESPHRPSREALGTALEQFRGTFSQRPPAYSAKQIGGVRAYTLARREDGAALNLKSVEVTVSRLELVAFDGTRAALSMRVSAGFYVRSLAHDLGRALGMGATLEALRRTRAGSFGLGEAVTADVLATSDPSALAGRMIPLSHLLPEVPALTLTPAEATSARHGMDVPSPSTSAEVPALTRLLDEHGGLLALATPSRRPGFLHPSVVLS